MKQLLFSLLCFFFFSCEKTEEPDIVISYGVSSLNNHAQVFSVSYLDNKGNTIEEGDFTEVSWGSPTYEKGFKRGDLVQIEVTAKNSDPNMIVTLYKNYFIFKEVRLTGSQGSVTISETLE